MLLVHARRDARSGPDGELCCSKTRTGAAGTAR